MPKTLTVSDETWDRIKDQVEEDALEPVVELDDLVGKEYAFQCARYIYFGTVDSINSTFITLKNASIVYDTGELNAKEPSDKQALPKGIQIMWGAVETFQKMNWK